MISTDMPLSFDNGVSAYSSLYSIDPRSEEDRLGIVKALVLGQGIESEPSRSFYVDSELESLGYKDKFIRPPFDPLTWSLIPENNTRLFRAVNAWAINTVGLGWNISAKDFSGKAVDMSEQSAAVQNQFKKEEEALLRLFSFPNNHMPFTTVMKLIKKDEEATGNGYMEVVRNNKGKIVSLYHVPSVSMRVLQDGKGFIQIRGIQFSQNPDTGNSGVSGMVNTRNKPSVRFFKNFGDFDHVSSSSGRRQKILATKNRATEIIHFKLDSPRSSVYGVPRYVAAAPAIAGNRLSAEKNVMFFDNDAVPRAILSVTGGKLDTDSIKRVEEFFKKKAQGVENAGRLLVLQVTPVQTGLNKESTTSIDFKPITVGVTEDASFLAYRAANDEEIREAMELSEVYYSVDLVNRSSGETSRQVTEEQAFEPDRVHKEFLINHTIVADAGWGLNQGEGPGIEIARLSFDRPKTLDPMDKAQVDTMYSNLGVKTVNEIRADLAMDPLPDDHHYASKPLVVALAELTAGVAVTTGDENLFENRQKAEDDRQERNLAMQEQQIKAQAEAAKRAEKQSPSEGSSKRAEAESRFPDERPALQVTAGDILRKSLELREEKRFAEKSNNNDK